MLRGVPCFLNTRPAAEAWRTVKQLLLEEAFNQKSVATRLGVHHRTLFRWFQRNPSYREQFERMRAERLAREVT